MEENKKRIKIIKDLCISAVIDFSKFLSETEDVLRKRIAALYTPNEDWFKKGKTLERYYRFLQDMTKREWEIEEVKFWFDRLRTPSESREEIPLSLRYEILVRDQHTCQMCGRKPPTVELAVDHILPWSFGGATVADNLQTLCVDCNLGKSNKTFKVGGLDA